MAITYPDTSSKNVKKTMLDSDVPMKFLLDGEDAEERSLKSFERTKKKATRR